MRCVTRVLFAASTIPEPVASARGSAFGGDACGRRTVPCRHRPVGAAVSRRWRSARINPVDAAGIVTQDLAVFLEPVGRRCMVGRHAQMLAGKSITSVSGLRPLRKVQLSAAASALIPISGRLRLLDLVCELRLQRVLSALGHAAEIDGLQALTVGVVEGGRATGRLAAPAGFGTAALAGPQRHHDTVQRGGDCILRDVLRFPDVIQGAETFPVLLHGQALQGAHRRRHGAELAEERLRCRPSSSAQASRLSHAVVDVLNDR